MFTTAFILAVIAAASTPVVSVAVSPAPVYVETDGQSQSINLDLLVNNDAQEVLELDAVEMSVLDSSGKLVLRRFIDDNGVRPSIRTADVASVAPGSGVLIFNPFERFDAGIDLNTLKFTVRLSSEDGERSYEASTEVHPVIYRNRTRLTLPLQGPQIVYDGHDFYSHHRRWDYQLAPIRALGFHTNFMRYGYDFVAVDREGKMSNGPVEKNESWFGFGSPVRAAGDGVIVAVHSQTPDDRHFSPADIAEKGSMSVFGNYVVIDHGNGEFSLYGHLQQGNSRVHPGQKVSQGEVIAAVGASGSALFPHLHFELQNGPGTDAEGLPSTFVNFDRLLGSNRQHVRSGLVSSGELLDTALHR